jgi:DNA-directed RNA polymerase subunit RPC12/RpoP
VPRYEYECDCGTAFQAELPMDRAGERQPCPRCRSRVAKNAVPSSVSVRTFRPYAAVSQGVPPYVQAAARQDEHGNWNYRDPETGCTQRLNLPGEKWDARAGAPLISSSADRRRFMKERGELTTGKPLVELSDYSNLRETHQRIQAAAQRKTDAAARRERLRKGAQAAARRGRKIGWVRDE